jgi:hypothetical protein
MTGGYSLAQVRDLQFGEFALLDERHEQISVVLTSQVGKIQQWKQYAIPYLAWWRSLWQRDGLDYGWNPTKLEPLPECGS